MIVCLLRIKGLTILTKFVYFNLYEKPSCQKFIARQCSSQNKGIIYSTFITGMIVDGTTFWMNCSFQNSKLAMYRVQCNDPDGSSPKHRLP